jgi:hypothetical protein
MKKSTSLVPPIMSYLFGSFFFLLYYIVIQSRSNLLNYPMWEHLPAKHLLDIFNIVCNFFFFENNIVCKWL